MQTCELLEPELHRFMGLFRWSSNAMAIHSGDPDNYPGHASYDAPWQGIILTVVRMLNDNDISTLFMGGFVRRNGRGQRDEGPALQCVGRVQGCMVGVHSGRPRIAVHLHGFRAFPELLVRWFTRISFKRLVFLDHSGSGGSGSGSAILIFQVCCPFPMEGTSSFVKAMSIIPGSCRA